MKYTRLMSMLVGMSLSTQIQAATLIESFDFADPVGTGIASLTNSAGSASFSGNAANAVTDGSGNLAVSAGSDASDNIFRNATLTTTGVSTGLFELSFTISSASIAGGDDAGANVGFGIRESGSNQDLFILRLQRQGSELRLQTRIGTTNTDLVDFNATSVSNLTVTGTFDLDTNTMDVSWSEDSVGSGSSTGIAIQDLNMDALRFASNTNTNDWGAGDVANISSLTLSQVPEPSSLALLALAGLTLSRRKR